MYLLVEFQHVMPHKRTFVYFVLHAHFFNCTLNPAVFSFKTH